MRRFLTTTLAVLGLVAGLHAIDGLSETSTKAITATTATGAPTRTDEIDRLIDVFTERTSGDVPALLSRIELGRLHLQRAHITSDLDDYDRAIETLRTAHRSEPGETVAVPLAQAQVAIHDFAGAVATLAPIDLATPAALATAFDAHLGLGTESEARAALDELLVLRPTDPAVLIRQSELAWATGRPDLAVDLALAALDAARRDGADVTFHRSAAARALLRTGEYERAAELAGSAIAAGARPDGAMLVLARAQAAVGDLDAALTIAGRAAEQTPDPATLSFLADVHFALGNDDAAIRELEAIEAVAALGHTANRRAVALARAEHGRSLDEAFDAATIELSERDDVGAHHLMATVLQALGRSDEAEAHAARAIDVQDADAWFRAGSIAADNGDTALAVQRLQTAIAISPDFHPLRAGIARTMLEELTR